MQYTQMGKGSNPSWVVCGYKQSVSRGDVESAAMTIMVKENSDKKDVHNVDVDDDPVIAVGIVPNLLLAGSRPGEEVEIDVELFSPTYLQGDKNKTTLGNKTNSLGHLTMYVTVDDTTGKELVVQASPRVEGEEGAEEFQFTDGLLCLSI